ncbi:DsbC family protein [Caballeronia arationis]|uniref:DsbC family protein n=1 Tax=Caballeronia arationis TaxID=1777142 RepID=UPI00119825BB|nr:DsbC family protein [Caballeronia arationis]
MLYQRGTSMKLRSMLGVCAAALIISSALLLPGPTARAHDEASATQMQDRHVDFASLPFSHAIKTLRGSGSRKLAVFADPYCPYCRTLERRLSELSNVTIYTFLFPILTADSKLMAAAIWCASDREATWRRWMLDGRPPARGHTCAGAPIDSNLDLARGLGIKITPTIIFASGEMVTGALPLYDLKSMLSP